MGVAEPAFGSEEKRKEVLVPTIRASDDVPTERAFDGYGTTVGDQSLSSDDVL